MNLLADMYNRLIDVLHDRNLNLESLSYSVILPSSYRGEDRFKQVLYQGSIVIDCYFGLSTIFSIHYGVGQDRGLSGDRGREC